jgi:F-type H+-transporting ATPase subunit epsilon
VSADEGRSRTFDLSLVTPEGAAFEGEVEMLIVPGADGEIGVLARHAPLVAMLNAGETRIRIGNDWTWFATGPGFFKVQRDRALVLVDEAVNESDIDVAAAEREAEAARAEIERLREEDPEADVWRVEQRLRHAENQVRVAGR